MREVKGHVLQPVMSHSNYCRCIHCGLLVDFKVDMGFTIYRHIDSQSHQWVAGISECKGPDDA